MFMRDGDHTTVALDGSGAVPLELTPDGSARRWPRRWCRPGWRLGHHAGRGGAIETAWANTAPSHWPRRSEPARRYARPVSSGALHPGDHRGRSGESIASDPVARPPGTCLGGRRCPEGSTVRQPATGRMPGTPSDRKGAGRCWLVRSPKPSSERVSGPTAGFLSEADMARHRTLGGRARYRRIRGPHGVADAAHRPRGRALSVRWRNWEPRTPVDWKAVLDATRSGSIRGLRSCGHSRGAAARNGPRATPPPGRGGPLSRAVSLITSGVSATSAPDLGVAEIGGPNSTIGHHPARCCASSRSRVPSRPIPPIPGLVTRDGRLRLRAWAWPEGSCSLRLRSSCWCACSLKGSLPSRPSTGPGFKVWLRRLIWPWSRSRASRDPSGCARTPARAGGLRRRPGGGLAPGPSGGRRRLPRGGALWRDLA